MTTDSLTPLVLRAQSGDRDAFSDLVVLFQSRIYSLVMLRLRNTAEADEVVQEVFLRAFCKLSQLQGAERFSGWLCRIAVRLSINRVVRRPHETSREPHSFDGVQKAEDAPFFAMIRQENCTRLVDDCGKSSEPCSLHE